jgi:hypothetical protein
MKLGRSGKLQQGVLRTISVPDGITVKLPARLSTATSMATPGKSVHSGNMIAKKLNGPLTAGRSGGVVVIKK